ncbi:MAG TPA: DUF5916 domain-containing protein [Kofleriaceae bacterium]|jgi:hypothetical protein|nr:DUF5916 domain-containing protein [Kofleriaceae bacterium]
MLRRAVVIGALLVASLAAAQAPLSVRARAVRRDGSVAIDGRLDERAWKHAPTHTGFTQRFPKDGGKAELETRFAVLYDDDALYIGVWADDPEPAKIRRLLTRRDLQSPSDVIAVGIDSYHDRRTAYVFQLNAAGVQRDTILFDDTNEDETWDAVWTGDVAVHVGGWTAEFRIPLNQLRFSEGDAQEWGLQVLRVVSRTQEQTAWSPWPRSGPQIVSKFGVVEGIAHLRPGRRLELLPYASAGAAMLPVADGDPLNDPTSPRANLGLDLKYGLGSAFTLAATINPDFGQVEADPSQVNLGANELFFPERRPFFLEGVDLFKLPIREGNPDGQFYSRRIGAAPPAPDAAYQYIDAPTATTIYGAAKLTGKTRGGWSLGLLDAVTGEESATLADGAGMRSSAIVAPLTNYAALRVKRDLDHGRTTIGMSATSVNRRLDDTPLVATLHDQAYTGGLQLLHRFGDSAWQADISTVASFVHGSEDAIALTQRANRHLYQRPDATHAHFDPTRTSLGGAGAGWKIGKMGDTKHVRYMLGGELRTIGLELNDMGFQTMSDRLIPFLWGQYREDAPGDRILNWRVEADVFSVSTLEPTLTDYGIETNGGAQLANYWSFNFNLNLVRSVIEPSALRGGPSLRQDPNAFVRAGFETDSRKAVRFSFGANGSRTWASHSIEGGVEAGVTVQARSNIDVFLGPSFSDRNSSMQYVTAADDTNGRTHYVFSRIRQRTASMTVRVNWTFSPRLALQAYAQPFISAGRFTELKDVDQPRAARWEDRFTPLTGDDYMLADGVYTVRSPTGGTYTVASPDFDFRQLRSTVVLRWEYLPGSTVFAIWSHGRTSEIADGEFRIGRDLSGLADADGEHVVMLKANYWIGL